MQVIPCESARADIQIRSKSAKFFDWNAKSAALERRACGLPEGEVTETLGVMLAREFLKVLTRAAILHLNIKACRLSQTP